MVFIPPLGYDVPFEVWLQAFSDFQLCQHECSVAQHQCGQGCVESFPIPPLGNVTPGLACAEACAGAHLACLDLCQLNFFLDLGFNGVPEDHKNPVEDLNNKLKPTFGNTRRRLKQVGGIFTYAGRAAVIIGKRLGNQSVRFMGDFGVFAGGGLINAERLIKSAEEDPPDEDFAQIFRPRRFRVQDLLPAFLLESDAALLFLPLISETLLTISYLEGLAVSLDRASSALAAGDTEKHFAQLRASQRYAKACSGSLKRMQDARLTVADKLAGLSVEVDEEPIPRVLVAALFRDFGVSSIRTRERRLIITHADAIEGQQQWIDEGIDQHVRDFIEQIARSEDEASSIIEEILGFELSRDDFDKSIAAILQNSELTAVENELVQALDEWEGFYR